MADDGEVRSQYTAFRTFQLEDQLIPDFFERRDGSKSLLKFQVMTTDVRSGGGSRVRARWEVVLECHHSEFLSATVTLVSVENSPTNAMEALCQFTIKDLKGKRMGSMRHISVYDLTHGKASSEVRIISYDELIKKKNGQIHDGGLIVCGYIGIEEEEEEEEEKDGGRKPTHIHSSGSFQDMFNDGFLSEVLSKAAVRNFSAHKIINASTQASRGMFPAPNTTSQPTATQLVGIKASLMEHLLEYIYTDNISGSIDANGLELLKVAKTFKLGLLIDICERRMVINGDNFAEILVYAHGVSAAILKRRASDFIRITFPRSWTRLSGRTYWKVTLVWSRSSTENWSAGRRRV